MNAATKCLGLQLLISVPTIVVGIGVVAAINGIEPGYGTPIVVGMFGSAFGVLVTELRDAKKAAREQSERVAILSRQVIDLETDLESRDERFAL